MQKEMYAVPQVVELVEEMVVVQNLEGDLIVVLGKYHYNKFVGRVKMHLATSNPKVKDYCRNLIALFIISGLLVLLGLLLISVLILLLIL